MSNINLNLYRIFCKVAQSKSYSEAAEKLSLSVPNVSKQISSLEEQLNLKLFNRESKGVTLTSDGQELYEIVNKSISSFDFAEKLAKDKGILASSHYISTGGHKVDSKKVDIIGDIIEKIYSK